MKVTLYMHVLIRGALIFILVLATTGSCLSQSTVQLDAKYGFKHFVLNTPPSKYNTEIAKTKSWNPNKKFTQYKYIGDNIKDLYGVPIDDITFTYYESKLCGIQISFGNLNKEFKLSEFERIKHSLEKLFGECEIGTPIKDEDVKLIDGGIWKGKMVTLELLRLHYKPSDGIAPNSITGYMSIGENSLREKSISDEF